VHLTIRCSAAQPAIEPILTPARASRPEID
jgi:hypothetical protein